MIGLLFTDAGGTGVAAPPRAPNTAVRSGATCARSCTCAPCIIRGVATIPLRPTVRPATIWLRGTAVTAPATFRFMYLVLLTFTLLNTVRFTITVFVTFTRSMYAGLYRYPGTHTSRGPSGNHPTAGPTPMPTLNPPPPTQATIAGEYTGRGPSGPGTQPHPSLAYTQRP
jgi:hypothetical protein